MTSESLQQDQENPSFKDVARYVFRHGTKKTLCLQSIATLAAFASGAALPGLMLLWGDMGNDFLRYAMFDPEYSASAFQRDINNTALIMVYLFLGKVVASYAYMILYTMAAGEIACNMRASHVKLTLNQSVTAVDAINDALVGGITQSLQDIAKVEIGLGEQLGTAMQLISILVSALIISLIQQWKLALVVYTVIPLTLFTVAATVVGDVKLDIELRKRLESASSLAKDALANVRDVFACTAESYFTSQYNTVLEEAMRFGFRKAPVIGVQYSSELFFVSIGYTLSFCSLTGISVQVLALSSAFGAAQGLTKFTKTHEESVAPKCASTTSPKESFLPEKKIPGHIEFRNVSFSYPSRPNVLICNNLSFEFPAGKTTAVVGASGSGKSTVVALIERWFEIDSGEICLDGVNICHLDPHWFRKQIGLVNQEPTLFQGTIYDNIARGLIGTPYEHISGTEKMQRIEDACDIADATGFVSRLPEGYNTWIGQGGGTLSGGQKQRIAIARAVVSDPRILILDEPTAALDALTERTVLSALERASAGRTCICVTHKPQQASTADYILMVTPAGIAERGSPKDLSEKGGLFNSFMASYRPSSDVTQEKEEHRDTSNVVAVTKKDDPWTDTIPSDVEEQQNQAAQAADYSLLRCIAIIMWGHRQYWPSMLAMFIPCILGGTIFPVEAVLFGEMVRVFGRPVITVHHAMQPWVYAFLGLAFVTLIIYGMIGYFGTILNYKLGREHRLQYFRCIITQNMAFFDEKNNSPGILATKLIKHPDEIEDMLGRNIPVIIIILVTSICCTLLAIAIGWKFGLVSVFGCLVPVCIAGAGFAADSVTAMRTVIALCLQDVLSSEYREMLERPLKIARKMAFATYLFLALVDSLSICGFALSFWYGGTLLARREYRLEHFYIIFAAIIFGTQSIARLFGFTYSFTKGKFAANHVLGWSTTPQIHVSQPPQSVHHLQNNDIAVAFRNVYFRYSTRAKIVLRDVSFEISRGQKVAFVGRSGSGKSTIFSLLERFYEYTDGDIRLLGCSLKDFDVNTTRNQIAIVSQHPFLYKGTIKENLLLGLSRTVSEEDLRETCQQTAIWDFISSLPAGLETPCGGNGGISFSGGQRQRLIIARALLRKPQILLLDEATSSLDVENEKIIVNAITQLPAHVTVIANAHRLASIRNFDMIFVMEDGRVVERGNYADLMRRKGRFFDLTQSQASF